MLGSRFVFAVMLTLCSLPTCPQSAMAQDDKWKLVWSDEFDGETLDYSKWEAEVNAFGGGNQELQLYTDRKENLRVEAGHLVLEARKDKPDISGTVRDYSSARIRSKHRGDWKYGRFEVRARLPGGKGVWPAIWMLPTDEVYGKWASSGEIDIMEFKGQEPNIVHGTLHFGKQWPGNQYQSGQMKLKTGNFTDDFHVFAIEWEEGVIRWYVDGEIYQTQKEWTSVGGPYPAPFNQRFHLLLNLAIGGNFLGNPDGTTPFPRQYLIDYVRVYQRPGFAR